MPKIKVTLIFLAIVFIVLTLFLKYVGFSLKYSATASILLISLFALFSMASKDVNRHRQEKILEGDPYWEESERLKARNDYKRHKEAMKYPLGKSILSESLFGKKRR